MSDYKEATRRALALLSAHVFDLPEVLDERWVWETLGSTPEDRIASLDALCNMFIGLTSNLAEPEQIIAFLAERVEEIPDADAADAEGD